MSEVNEIIGMIIHSSMFKWTIGTTITTLMGWVLVSVRNTTNRIKEAPTKDDLAEVKDKSFRYTDDRMKVHEDKQILELTNLSAKINETHDMVGKLLDIHLKNK